MVKTKRGHDPDEDDDWLDDEEEDELDQEEQCLVEELANSE